VINKGEIILVEEKTTLMRSLGKKQLTLHLEQPLERIPAALSAHRLEIKGEDLIYTYEEKGDRAAIASLLADLGKAGIRFKDLQTTQSSLEDIFVTLLAERKGA
jgi:ABC-2 type transport system ATP-binding protein